MNMSNNYMKKSLIYGVRNIALIRNVRSVESVRVRGNRSAKEKTGRQSQR